MLRVPCSFADLNENSTPATLLGLLILASTRSSLDGRRGGLLAKMEKAVAATRPRSDFRRQARRSACSDATNLDSTPATLLILASTRSSLDDRRSGLLAKMEKAVVGDKVADGLPAPNEKIRFSRVPRFSSPLSHCY